PRRVGQRPSRGAHEPARVDRVARGRRPGLRGGRDDDRRSRRPALARPRGERCGSLALHRARRLRPPPRLVARSRGGPPSSRARTRLMELEPVKSIRIYEDIVRQVKTLIADGRLTSGDRLPPEPELAERSRPTQASVRGSRRYAPHRGLTDTGLGL